MRCKLVRLAAIAVVLCITAGTAWAYPPSNPYSPSGAELATSFYKDFSGGSQASQMMIMPKDDGTGINVWVTWDTGEEFVNEDFTRVEPVISYWDGTVGKNLTGYDGVKWCFMNAVGGSDIIVKPYTQSADGWAFHEGTQPGDPPSAGTGAFLIPADGQSYMVQIGWGPGDTSNGDQTAAESANMAEIGFQIYGPSPPHGTPPDQLPHSHFMIFNWVPEPTSFALVGLGLAMIGMFGRGRRS